MTTIAKQTSTMMFDRKSYFDSVRASLFASGMTQQQVDGQEAILSAWEAKPLSTDLRHLANPLAQSKHESASTMWPISEYGKGEGMSYGKPDPETGQTYYGRGLIQCTWRDNYARATKELGLTGDDDVEWHADRMLDPTISSDTMFRGMWEGWFRSGNTLSRFLNETTDDVFNCREIINGDKNYHVDWDDRVIGDIIADYHDEFLAALEDAVIDIPEPQPRPPRPPRPPRLPLMPLVVPVHIIQPYGTRVDVNIVEGPEPDWDELRRRYEQWRTGGG